MSENRISPYDRFERTSRSSVAAIRAYVSEEMLAETSRTTMPLDDAGIGDSVPGCRRSAARRARAQRRRGSWPRPIARGGRPVRSLEGGRVAEGDRHLLAHSRLPAACSTRSASAVTSLGAWIAPGPRDPCGVDRDSGLADEPAGVARRAATVGAVTGGGLLQQANGAKQRIDPAERRAPLASP